MEVTELVAISAIVDFLGIEGTLHGTGYLSYIGHEVVALLVVEHVKVVDVTIVCNEAAAMVGLLFEEEKTGNTEVTNLNHEILECVGAIQALFWIAVHNKY